MIGGSIAPLFRYSVHRADGRSELILGFLIITGR